MPNDNDRVLSIEARRLLNLAGFNKLIKIENWRTETYEAPILNRNNENATDTSQHSLQQNAKSNPEAGILK